MGEKAISNGLFESAADNAMVKHPDGLVTDDSAEPYGKVLSHEDTQAFYLSEFFINMLKNSNDPRLPLIATVCSNPSENGKVILISEIMTRPNRSACRLVMIQKGMSGTCLMLLAIRELTGDHTILYRTVRPTHVRMHRLCY